MNDELLRLDYAEVFKTAAGQRVLMDLVAFAGRAVTESAVRAGRSDVIGRIVLFASDIHPDPLTVKKDDGYGSSRS